jgi:transcriptional regulator
MAEDKIKEAFRKVREDMDFFHQEIESIKRTLGELKFASTQPKKASTNRQINSTHKISSTHNYPLKASKVPISIISTGNEGVQTDRQTNRQTDRHITKFALNKESSNLNKASEILNSLDDLKKEVRIKFKQLTNQEMLIYTTIYQLEEQNIKVDYSVVSKKLQLTESSIRDYIKRIIDKKIPLEKVKQGNKKVFLSIPQSIRKIASLNTIIQLREL